MQQQRANIQSDCGVRGKGDFIWQPEMISSVGGLRSSRACPKAKIAPIEGHRHCLVVCCPSDPLQLSESQWHHYIWEVCSANRWDALKTATPATSIGQQNGPNSPQNNHTTSASKVEQIGLWSCASSAIFTWLLTNRWPLLQTSQQLSAGKMLLQPAEGRKCFPRVHWILKHWFVYYKN